VAQIAGSRNALGDETAADVALTQSMRACGEVK
jgi:hypothetical protein